MFLALPRLNLPNPERDDAACVEAARAGQRSAYNDLYDRYAPLVRAVCHDTTRDLDQAQDLAQETFLRAFGKLRKLRKPDRFAPWLMSITRHVCREWERKRARDRHRYGELDLGVGATTTKNLDGDQLELLREVIAALPQVERMALHLFYLQERPAEQARALMNLSRSGFYRVLERARSRLKRRLRQEVS